MSKPTVTQDSLLTTRRFVIAALLVGTNGSIWCLCAPMGLAGVAGIMTLAVLVQGAEPRAIERTEPTYPPLAVAARIEKTVKLSVKVNPNGSVADIKVVDGHPLLNSVALEAVRQWKFTTTPVGGTTDVEIAFKAPVPFNGSVSGKVVDPDGKPMPDVRVTARRINYRHGRPSWVASDCGRYD